MVKKFTWLIALLLLLGTLVIPVTAQDGEGTPTPPAPQLRSLADTLVSLSETGDEFALFVENLEETELDITLHTGGPFTVFAPTDEAIDTYLRSQGITEAEFLENPQLVRQIMEYHVLPGRFLSREIINYHAGAMATLLPGTAVDITMLNDALYINESRVIGTDIAASNGVIYSIDTILLPPESGLVFTEPEATDSEATPDETDETPEPLFTLNLLSEHAELAAFVTAIQSSAAMTGLVNGAGPFTIFAPTDAGFGRALEEMGISGNDLVADTERLNTTLFYHVIPIVLSPENLADLDGVYIGTTAQGIAVKVNVVDGETYVNRGRVSDHFTASNGNIFVVDFLLLESDSRLSGQAIEAMIEDNEAEESTDETSEDSTIPADTETTDDSNNEGNESSQTEEETSTDNDNGTEATPPDSQE